MNIKTKETINGRQGQNKQVVSTVVDTLQPASSLPGSGRGAAFQKQVIVMRKDHSPHEIVFSPDNDTHFMNIEVKKRATGATVCQHFILKSDLPTWISYYEGDNFKIVEPKNEDNGK